MKYLNHLFNLIFFVAFYLTLAMNLHFSHSSCSNYQLLQNSNAHPRRKDQKLLFVTANLRTRIRCVPHNRDK
jgi:hypothetical protein